MSFSLVNLEIIWEKVCKFGKLAAHNLAHEFVGNRGLAGANEEVFSDEQGPIRSDGKRQGGSVLIACQHADEVGDGRPKVRFE